MRNCITSIFENKIADAKKTFPAVIGALKTRQARIALCDELAAHKSGNQVWHYSGDRANTILNGQKEVGLQMVLLDFKWDHKSGSPPFKNLTEGHHFFKNNLNS